MTKAKTVDVVYEDGVFKPRGPVGLAEGEKAIVTFEKARGVITL
ncbi:MAG: antitoxin family protein, partial [Methanosarcinales archaeon]